MSECTAAHAGTQESFTWTVRLGPFTSPAYLPVPGLGSQTSVDVVLGLQTAANYWCFLYHTVAARKLSLDGDQDSGDLNKDLEKLRFITFFRCSEGLEKGTVEAMG